VTESNKRENIREERLRAAAARRAAQVLVDNDLLGDAVSRLYYSLLHSVRALLLTEGLEPRSHGGALRLLSLHFVRSGRFAPSSAQLLSKLMKYREEADYACLFVFTRDDLDALLAEVDDLVRRVDSYLAATGYLEDSSPEP